MLSSHSSAPSVVPSCARHWSCMERAGPCMPHPPWPRTDWWMWWMALGVPTQQATLDGGGLKRWKQKEQCEPRLGARKMWHMLKKLLSLHLRHVKGRQFQQGEAGTKCGASSPYLPQEGSVLFHGPKSLEHLEIFGEAERRLHTFC